MSGGSSKKKSSSSSGGSSTPTSSNPTQTVQPFMPEMDIALAQQLAAGFGGNPADFMAAFQQTYSPMQVPKNPVYSTPSGSTSPKTTTTPTPAAPGNGGWDNGAETYWGR